MNETNKIKLIDLKKQQKLFRVDIEKSFLNILDHGQYIMGPEVLLLEKQLAQYAGVNYAVACSSGTDALLMMLMARDIQRGEVVFLPAFTFPATAEVVALIGAIPYFVDVEKTSMNLDPEALIEAIEDALAQKMSVRAILSVDLFGTPANYDHLQEIAREYGLDFFCDAAQSFGACYKGKRIEQLSLATATSFYPSKPLGAYGDAGAVFTNDSALYDKLIAIREHGSMRSDKYHLAYIGLNARMDSFQAAVLLEKLKLFDQELQAKRTLVKLYQKHLSSVLTCPISDFPEGTMSVWANYTVQLPAALRDQLRQVCAKEGIDTAIYYPKLINEQTPYKDYPCYPKQLPVSYELSQTVCSLPMHAYLESEDVLRICSVINACLSSSESDVPNLV